MNLGYEIAAILPDRRVLAESLMVDACVVEKPTGQTLDQETGQYVTDYEQIWSGKCRLQMRDTVPSTPRAGGQEFTVDHVEVQLPVDGTAVILPDHRVTVTAAAVDQSLVGRHFTVSLVTAKTHAAMRRLECEEVTG